MDKERLHKSLMEAMKKEDLWKDWLEEELPRKWEKHGDLVLFSSNTLVSGIWNCAGYNRIWEVVCSALKVKRVARKVGPIQNNGFRSPQIELLYGNDGWVTKKENGIIYSWDVTKSMFCSGNISEKQRLSKIDCTGQIVVDLYAGIGYFALTFLIHAKAALVYGIEWNPDAIHALKYNLRQNKVEDKCIVLEGNNLEVCPSDVADHVNLGLLPSSEKSWPIACKALSRTRGGILHIHENVETKKNGNETGENENSIKSYCPNNITFPDSLIGAPMPWLIWIRETIEKISNIFQTLYYIEKWSVEVLYVHKLKSYGPHIDHLVLDLQCIPPLPEPS